MIELHILFPILLDMTLLTLLPFLTLVDIIILMAVDAARLQLVLAQVSLVATHTHQFLMRTLYFELRVLVMIETNRSPHH